MVDFVSVVHWNGKDDEIHRILTGFVILGPWLER
jgi:hypothetical protein